MLALISFRPGALIIDAALVQEVFLFNTPVAIVAQNLIPMSTMQIVNSSVDK